MFGKRLSSPATCPLRALVITRNVRDRRHIGGSMMTSDTAGPDSLTRKNFVNPRTASATTSGRSDEWEINCAALDIFHIQIPRLQYDLIPLIPSPSLPPDVGVPELDRRRDFAPSVREKAGMR